MNLTSTVSRRRIPGIHRILAVAGMAVISWCACLGQAHAQGSGPGFHASVGGSDGCNFASLVSSPTAPASIGSQSYSCLSGSATVGGRADKGKLNTLTIASHTCCGTSSTTGASARFEVEDLVISGPAAASVNVALRFRLKGVVNVNSNGVASITLTTLISGSNTSAGTLSRLQINQSGPTLKDGLFSPLPLTGASVAFDNEFTTPTFTATPNVPLNVNVSLSVVSSANAGSSESDFFTGDKGFSLPATGVVFQVPAGYTVNSPSLAIADNYWLPNGPGDISVSPSSVNFGSVNVGSQSTAVVTATNTGAASLSVNSAWLGAANPAFSIASVKKGGAAVTYPVSLAPNETLDIELGFAPTSSGPANGMLNVGSNDPDEGTVSVSLTGVGVAVGSPFSQQIAELLTFFDQAVAAGTLQGAGPGSSAAGRLRALRNMITAAGDMITGGNLGGACAQLTDVLSRMDGAPQPPDFVTGSAVGDLRSRVQQVKSNLGCR